MSKKTQEQKQFDEFYNTPVGVVIQTLGNYNYIISEMLTEHPDEKDLKDEYEKSSEYMKKFVTAFENFEGIDDYYIDDTNVVVAILEKFTEEDRNFVLQLWGTYISMMTQSVDKHPKQLENQLVAAISLYNLIAPIFMNVDLGGDEYAKLLRQMFRFAIKTAEVFITQPKTPEDLEFGYEYKNYALVFRQKAKEIKSDANSVEFVFDFYNELKDDEKQFFDKAILGSFMDCTQSDVDKEKYVMENELEYLALARKFKWEFDKRNQNKVQRKGFDIKK